MAAGANGAELIAIGRNDYQRILHSIGEGVNFRPQMLHERAAAIAEGLIEITADQNRDLIEGLVRRVPLFNEMEESVRSEICSVASYRQVKMGNIVFNTESDSTEVFVVLEGIVKLSQEVFTGASAHKINEGQIFGHIEFLLARSAGEAGRQIPRIFSAKAMNDTRLLIVPASIFLRRWPWLKVDEERMDAIRTLPFFHSQPGTDDSRKLALLQVAELFLSAGSLQQSNGKKISQSTDHSEDLYVLIRGGAQLLWNFVDSTSKKSLRLPVYALSPKEFFSFKQTDKLEICSTSSSTEFLVISKLIIKQLFDQQSQRLLKKHIQEQHAWAMARVSSMKHMLNNSDEHHLALRSPFRKNTPHRKISGRSQSVHRRYKVSKFMSKSKVDVGSSIQAKTSKRGNSSVEGGPLSSFGRQSLLMFGEWGSSKIVHSSPANDIKYALTPQKKLADSIEMPVGKMENTKIDVARKDKSRKRAQRPQSAPGRRRGVNAQFARGRVLIRRKPAKDMLKSIPPANVCDSKSQRPRSANPYRAESQRHINRGYQNFSKTKLFRLRAAEFRRRRLKADHAVHKLMAQSSPASAAVEEYERQMKIISEVDKEYTPLVRLDGKDPSLSDFQTPISDADWFRNASDIAARLERLSGTLDQEILVSEGRSTARATHTLPYTYT